MTRPPLLPLPWPLVRALVAAALVALAPLAARAGESEDPNSPLGTGNPCFDLTQIAESLSLSADPESPLFFHGLEDCAKLCKVAGDSCARFAKRAAKCDTRFADDRAKFEIKTECNGLKGDAVKTCSAEFVTTRDARKALTATHLATELTECESAATTCTGKCDVAP